jgi:hypothetical protein
MKHKERIPEKSEQPKPLPALEQSAQPETFEARMERRKNDPLAPWQREIVDLGMAYLNTNDERDQVPRMIRRAISISIVVADMAGRQDVGSGIDEDALVSVMDLLREQLEVVKWITSGKPVDAKTWY